MGYGYVRTLTIDHTKCGASDSSNFPVLFSGTYSYLKTVSNGGNVTNANGYDIIFTSDAAGNTKLDHEIETYTATTGAVNFWVRVPTVSHTTDTVIYLWYGNAAITTSQENVTGVWDANFKGVWHLKETTGGTGAIKDSTSNANNGTDTGSPTLGATGEIGNAVTLNGTSQYIAVADAASLRITGSLTVSAWVNLPSLPTSGNYYYVAGKGYDNTNEAYFLRVNNVSGVQHLIFGTFGTPLNHVADWTGSIATGRWTYLTGTFDGSTYRVYEGTTLRASTTDSTAPFNTVDRLLLGAFDNNGTAQRFLNGSIDEARVSNTARSADWITTEYNNQNSPSTFYTAGAEAVVGTRLSLFLQAVQRAAVR